MSNYCSSCGKPINGDTSFCPNCGHSLNEDNQSQNFSIKQMGTSLALSSSIKRTRADWLAITISGITCLSMILLAFGISKILAAMFVGLLYCKRDVIRKALWSNGIFKPFIIHYAWGAVVVVILMGFLEDLARHSHGLISGPILSLTFIAFLLIANGVYYAGYRAICHFYKDSKPQGQFVRMLVSMGIIIVYALVKRDAKALDSLLSSDDIATSGMTAAVTTPSIDINNSDTIFDTSSADTTNNDSAFNNSVPQNQFDATNITAPNAQADTTIQIMDQMSQPAETIKTHTDGSADIFDANMQNAGHITSSGHILDALNMSSGSVEGNVIYDQLHQVAYTIDGDTIFDKNHQVAFMIRDGHIFDKLNQLVGSIK